jgi:glyoxylase-like metal-dependent hydrolase (beta-lactamase superfamily II)
MPTPGHTPGHLSLVARDGEGGWLLGGDAASTDIADLCAREGLTPLLAHDDDV